RSKRWRAVGGHERGQTWRRVAVRRQYEARSSERTRVVSTRGSSGGQSASAGAVEGAERGDILVGCRDVRCCGKTNHVIVRVQAEGNVIRNKEDPISGANHGLLIPAVGQTEPGRPLPLVQRDV